MSKTITLDFPPDGSPPTIEAHGFTGTSCVEATEFIERALGGVSERTAKPEMAQVTADNVITQS